MIVDKPSPDVKESSGGTTEFPLDAEGSLRSVDEPPRYVAQSSLDDDGLPLDVGGPSSGVDELPAGEDVPLLSNTSRLFIDVQHHAVQVTTIIQ